MEGGGGGGGLAVRGGSAVNVRVVGIDGGARRSYEGLRCGAVSFGSRFEKATLSSADIGLGLSTSSSSELSADSASCTTACKSSSCSLSSSEDILRRSSSLESDGSGALKGWDKFSCFSDGASCSRAAGSCGARASLGDVD